MDDRQAGQQELDNLEVSDEASTFGQRTFVDGTEVLAEDADADARTDFQRKTQKAFSTIVMAVSVRQLYLITSIENPSDAWAALKNQFERGTLANKLMLKKQYFRMEMTETTTVESHLKTMKELTDRLAAIDAPISEEDQVVTLWLRS